LTIAFDLRFNVSQGFSPKSSFFLTALYFT